MVRFPESKDSPGVDAQTGTCLCPHLHFRIQGTQQRSGEFLAQLRTWQAVHAREIFNKRLTLRRVPPPGAASDLSRPRRYLFASALVQQGTPREGASQGSEGRAWPTDSRAGSWTRGWSLNPKDRKMGRDLQPGGGVWSPRAGWPRRAAWLLWGVRVP